MLLSTIIMISPLLAQSTQGIRPEEIESPQGIPASLIALSDDSIGVQMNELWNGSKLSYSPGYVLSYKVNSNSRLSFVGRQNFGIEHPVIVKSRHPLTFEETTPYLASPPWSDLDLGDNSEQDFIHTSDSGVICTLKKWVCFKPQGSAAIKKVAWDASNSSVGFVGDELWVVEFGIQACLKRFSLDGALISNRVLRWPDGGKIMSPGAWLVLLPLGVTKALLVGASQKPLSGLAWRIDGFAGGSGSRIIEGPDVAIGVLAADSQVVAPIGGLPVDSGLVHPLRIQRRRSIVFLKKHNVCVVLYDGKIYVRPKGGSNE